MWPSSREFGLSRQINRGPLAESKSTRVAWPPLGRVPQAQDVAPSALMLFDIADLVRSRNNGFH
jgi:hypothetical protein